MFCELLSVKEPQPMLQYKKNYCTKLLENINIKKSPGIEGALFNCMGDMRMDNLDCPNSSFSFIISIL